MTPNIATPMIVPYLTAKKLEDRLGATLGTFEGTISDACWAGDSEDLEHHGSELGLSLTFRWSETPGTRIPEHLDGELIYDQNVIFSFMGAYQVGMPEELNGKPVRVHALIGPPEPGFPELRKPALVLGYAALMK